ncbi:MAG: hypothetical protein IKN25_07875 [Spirochaetales bacterium]|nr:hypothetical protein [Spirochaetales bacterium]
MLIYPGNLKPQMPYKNILTRLGARLSTQISDKDRAKIDSAIYTAASYIAPKGVYAFFDCRVDGDKVIVTEPSDGTDILTMQSSKLALNLSECSEVCLMAVTAGADIVAYRDSRNQSGDTFGAVIADAVGSEYAEAAVELLHGIITQNCLRKGQSVNRMRFSPGYGDLSLSYQHDIAGILRMDKIGVTVSESNIMFPEKSVTAFVGIK